MTMSADIQDSGLQGQWSVENFSHGEEALIGFMRHGDMEIAQMNRIL